MSNSPDEQKAHRYSDSHLWKKCLRCGVSDPSVVPVEFLGGLHSEGLHPAEEMARCISWQLPDLDPEYNAQHEKKVYDLQQRVHLLEDDIANFHSGHWLEEYVIRTCTEEDKNGHPVEALVEIEDGNGRSISTPRKHLGHGNFAIRLVASKRKKTNG